MKLRFLVLTTAACTMLRAMAAAAFTVNNNKRAGRPNAAAVSTSHPKNAQSTSSSSSNGRVVTELRSDVTARMDDPLMNLQHYQEIVDVKKEVAVDKSTKNKKDHADLFQSNARKAWLYMTLYWGIGVALGAWRGYFSGIASNGVGWLLSRAARSPLHWMALAATVWGQLNLQGRYTTFGRKRDLLGTLTFAFGNGIAETMLFLLSYDLGRFALSNLLRLGNNPAISMVLGFFTYCCYSALIHIKFWLPHGLPQHCKPNIPPYHTHAVPWLLMFSLTWFALYEVHADIFGICALHCLVDAWVGENIHITLPSFRRNNQQWKQVAQVAA